MTMKKRGTTVKLLTVKIGVCCGIYRDYHLLLFLLLEQPLSLLFLHTLTLLLLMGQLLHSYSTWTRSAISELAYAWSSWSRHA